MKLGVAVLAAGQGTRMCSDLPKVLHPLAGRGLLAHVLEAADAIEAERVCVVYGHGGDAVPGALSGRDCAWVEQTERLGTAHAVLQAMPALAEVDRVLVLYGDVPLIRPQTLLRLIEQAADVHLGLLTMKLVDPAGYGRIVRDHAGCILRIVEQNDASEAELAIHEVNTGIVIADRARLAGWLDRVGGMALGLLFGAIVVSCLLIALLASPLDDGLKDEITDHEVTGPLVHVAPAVYDVVRNAWAGEEFFQMVREHVEPAARKAAEGLRGLVDELEADAGKLEAAEDEAPQ